MIGWAAVTGGVSLESLILFAIIFLWTPPHFWALALYRNSDYTRAGVPMMPVVAGARHTKQLMAIYTVLLVAITLSLPVLNMAGIVYTPCSIALGGTFLYHIYKVWKDASDKWARKTFLFSIFYLFALFSVLMADNILMQHLRW